MPSFTAEQILDLSYIKKVCGRHRAEFNAYCNYIYKVYSLEVDSNEEYLSPQDIEELNGVYVWPEDASND